MSSKVDYFCSKTIRQDLKRKTVRGGVYTAYGQAGGIIIQLASTPLLARLLTKDDFGLVAMVTVFTGFAGMFVDAGMSMATVQREKISHNEVTNMFWLASALGLVMALITAVFSPTIAWFYSEPRLLLVAAVMGTAFFFGGLTVQHRALLTRTMQFRSLAIIAIVAQLISQLVAIYLAWRFETYWALAIRQVVFGLVAMLATWWLAGWRPGLPKRETNVRSIVGFGANLTGFHTINYIARNTDRLLIGRLWGEGPLGVYDQAYRLLMLPIRKLAPIMSNVVIPALSRLRDDPARYRATYMAAARPLAWASALGVGLLFAISDPLVVLYLSPKWEEVGFLFKLLAPGCWATAVSILAGWVYTSWGHVDRQLRWVILHSAIVTVTVVCAVPFGVQATALAVGIFQAVLRIPAFYYAYRGTPIETNEVLRLLATPLLIGSLCAATALLVANRFAAQLGPVVELVVIVSTYVAICGALIAFTPQLSRDVRQMVNTVRSIRNETRGGKDQRTE